MFTAKLKCHNVKPKRLKKKVSELLKTLGLYDCRNVVVGDRLLKGISGGQKKRVSAGVELICSPSILFLDEPTSGLDSFSSLALIKALKNIAQQQNSIICCTIHQPSSELFALFDRVMCLRSGQTLFSGSLRGEIVDSLHKLALGDSTTTGGTATPANSDGGDPRDEEECQNNTTLLPAAPSNDEELSGLVPLRRSPSRDSLISGTSIDDAPDLGTIPNLLFQLDIPQPSASDPDPDRASFGTNICDWLLYLAQTLDGPGLIGAAEMTKIFYEYDKAKWASIKAEEEEQAAGVLNNICKNYDELELGEGSWVGHTGPG